MYFCNNKAIFDNKNTLYIHRGNKELSVGIGKIGASIGKKIIAWTRTSGKSLLETRPVKVNIKGLKYASPPYPNLNLSEKAKFISKLEQNYSKSEIKIGKNSYIKYENSQMGSNPAFWAKDANTGELYYIKHAETSHNFLKSEHLESEHIANKLYNLVGIQTPQTELCELTNGVKALKIKYSNGMKNISEFKQVHSGFATDAWLANWDALIDNNTRIVNGRLFKLDCGGSLRYRAQGKLKPDFGEKVKEIVTLVDGHNYQAKQVYESISHQDLINSFKKVCSLTDEQINATVKDRTLASILIKRRDYMRTCLEKIEQTPYNGKNISQYMKNIQKEVDYREYTDIAEDMIKQRTTMRNTLHPRLSVEEQLGLFKENYVSQSRDIKNNIMTQLGDENAILTKNITHCIKLDELIVQGRLPRATTLYRGASPYDFGLHRMDSKEFIKRFYKKGRIFRIPTYPETSLDRKVGEEYAKGRILFKFNASEGTPSIYMEELKVPLSGGYGNEEEIMLARDMLYKFKNHIETTDFDIIEIDVVKKAPFWKKVHEFWNEVPKKYWEK